MTRQERINDLKEQYEDLYEQGLVLINHYTPSPIQIQWDELEPHMKDIEHLLRHYKLYPKNGYTELVPKGCYNNTFYRNGFVFDDHEHGELYVCPFDMVQSYISYPTEIFLYHYVNGTLDEFNADIDAVEKDMDRLADNLIALMHNAKAIDKLVDKVERIVSILAE